MVVGCGPACGGSGCWFALGCACSGVGAGLDVWAEAGCKVGWVSAAFCATALSESSRVAVTIEFKVRITRISMFLQKPSVASIRQLENHVYDRGGIHRLTIALRRFEAHPVRSSDGGFIQPMTEPADHAIHVQLSPGSKAHFQQNLSLQPKLAGLLGIRRIRFEEDLNRRARRT